MGCYVSNMHSLSEIEALFPEITFEHMSNGSVNVFCEINSSCAENLFNLVDYRVSGLYGPFYTLVPT